MHVSIYSDVVCPWCYIGKARFEKALEQLAPEDRAEITYSWMPYQLDPTAPATPSAVLDAYARKFGGPEKAFKIIEHVTQTAAGEGIEFHMEIAQRANTFPAHRLLWMALHDHGPQLQNEMKARLLRAYFSEGVDVGNIDNLVRLAAEVGLSEDAVRDFFAGDRGLDETRQELAEAQMLGITGVPNFVINGQWSIPGAQDTETFVRVLNKLLAKSRELAAEAELAAVSTADACAADGSNC